MVLIKMDLMNVTAMQSRRRRHSPEEYSTRLKRSRREYPESAYLKEIPRERRSPVERFGMRRDMFMNGGYSDYMREYHQQRPPVPQLPYGPPYSAQTPYQMEMPYYDRSPMHHHHHHHNHHPDFAAPRSRPLDKRSYERSVDDFLRRTTRPPSRGDRRYRDRR